MTTRPSASYGPLLAAYLALASALAFAVRRSARHGGGLTRPRISDVLLVGLGTFKLSRLVTKEKVLQPVREPFVVETEPAEGSEVNNEPAGTGIRRALGELLTCPFCMSMWIAPVFTAAFTMAPRAARVIASGLAAVVIADASQYAYTGLRKAAR